MASTSKDEDKIVLIHIDAQTSLADVQKELEWTGKGATTFLYHKVLKEILAIPADWESRLPAEDELFNRIMGLESIDITAEYTVNSCSGICLSLCPYPASSGAKNTNIKIYTEKRQPTLLHHYREREKMYVQRVEDVFLCETPRDPTETRTLTIFHDGWLELVECDQSTPKFTMAKKEDSEVKFEKSMSFFDLSMHLALLSAKKMLQDAMSLAGNTVTQSMALLLNNLATWVSGNTYYLEGHLKGYSFYPSIFKENMCDALKKDVGTTPTLLSVKACLRKILSPSEEPKDKEDLFEAISTALDPLKTLDSKDGSEPFILEKFNLYAAHYHHRQYYEKFYKQRQDKLGEADTLCGEANASYKRDDFEPAFQAFSSALRILCQHCLKNQKTVASTYYNCGRCLQKLGRHGEALEHLKEALNLREKYQPEDPKGIIVKTRQRLQESQEALKKENSEEAGKATGLGSAGKQ